MRVCVRVLPLLCVLSCAISPALAEVSVLTAGKIHTMDASRPHAQAMAFDTGGRILAVGSIEAMSGVIPMRAGSMSAMPP